jgi:hypothetical protein
LTGAIIVDAGMPEGSYSVTYIFCGTLYPQICDTAAVLINVIDIINIPIDYVLENPLTWHTRVYFHNDRPKPADLKPSFTYANSYRLYVDSIQKYYLYSSDSRDEVVQFWEMNVDAGWQALQQMQKAIAAHLEKGGKVELKLSGYCSPLHTGSYNDELAKRRVEVVKRYLLKAQTSKSNVAITTQFVGEAEASPNISADLKNAPASVYGIKASLERRVEVKVVFK